jgi:hypothetical protein
MPSETASSVTGFFDSYRAAFERLDAGAIADHFAYPAHITSDSGEIYEIGLMSVVERGDWIGWIEHLLGMYRAVGFSSARVGKLATTALSPRLVQATVQWALHDAAGRPLYDFEATYSLAKINGAFRIAAIAHNEIPRYRACLAKVGSSSA